VNYLNPEYIITRKRVFVKGNLKKKEIDRFAGRKLDVPAEREFKN